MKYKVTKTYQFSVSHVVEKDTPEEAGVSLVDEKDFLHQLWVTLMDTDCKVEEW